MKLIPALRWFVPILNNCIAWFKHYNIPVPQVYYIAPDRVLFKTNPQLELAIDQMYTAGQLQLDSGSGHGLMIDRAYRESVGRGAAQLVFHKWGALEMDFDLAHPWDVVGIIHHGWEVIKNKLTKSKTNQEKVAALLRKRGIDGE